MVEADYFAIRLPTGTEEESLLIILASQLPKQ